MCHNRIITNLDDVQGLVNGGLGVEGQPGIDLSGDLAGDDLEDLLAELDKEAVQSSVDLLVDGLALLLTVGNSSVNEGSVLGLLGSGQDQGWVGGGILGLVLADGCETLLADLAHGLILPVCPVDSTTRSRHTGKVTCKPRVSGEFHACISGDRRDIPESQTTTVPVALSCSREEDMMMCCVTVDYLRR